MNQPGHGPGRDRPGTAPETTDAADTAGAAEVAGTAGVVEAAEAARAGGVGDGGAVSFGEAFQRALRGRGLSLQRLHHHLARRGISVSPVTLSHWQRGRSQPERHQSLLAVTEIEAILGTPSGELRNLLSPRRPRGRAVAADSGVSEAMSRILTPGAPLEKALGAAAYRFNEHLVSLSVHETVRLDAYGCIARYTVSHVVRATRDGVRRLTAHHNLDDPATPSVQVTVGCGRLEALLFRQELASAVIDIGFGRELRRGDTAIVEYALDVGPRWKPSDHHERTLPVPVRQYLLHVFFHPRNPPPAVYGYYRHSSRAARENVRPLALDASHSVHILPAKCRPGIYGVCWNGSSAAEPPDRPARRSGD